MLSFGIEASRAFSIAFWRAMFPAGSGPPSRAATMIARVSLENSWPRFASVAPFFRLIDAHLLCPDISAGETMVPPRGPSFLWGEPRFPLAPLLTTTWAPAGQSPAPPYHLPLKQRLPQIFVHAPSLGRA